MPSLSLQARKHACSDNDGIECLSRSLHEIIAAAAEENNDETGCTVTFSKEPENLQNARSKFVLKTNVLSDDQKTLRQIPFSHLPQAILGRIQTKARIEFVLLIYILRRGKAPFLTNIEKKVVSSALSAAVTAVSKEPSLRIHHSCQRFVASASQTFTASAALKVAAKFTEHLNCEMAHSSETPQTHQHRKQLGDTCCFSLRCYGNKHISAWTDGYLPHHNRSDSDSSVESSRFSEPSLAETADAATRTPSLRGRPARTVARGDVTVASSLRGSPGDGTDLSFSVSEAIQAQATFFKAVLPGRFLDNSEEGTVGRNVYVIADIGLTIYPTDRDKYWFLPHVKNVKENTRAKFAAHGSSRSQHDSPFLSEESMKSLRTTTKSYSIYPYFLRPACGSVYAAKVPIFLTKTQDGECTLHFPETDKILGAKVYSEQVMGAFTTSEDPDAYGSHGRASKLGEDLLRVPTRLRNIQVGGGVYDSESMEDSCSHLSNTSKKVKCAIDACMAYLSHTSFSVRKEVTVSIGATGSIPLQLAQCALSLPDNCIVLVERDANLPEKVIAPVNEHVTHLQNVFERNRSQQYISDADDSIIRTVSLSALLIFVMSHQNALPLPRCVRQEARFSGILGIPQDMRVPLPARTRTSYGVKYGTYGKVFSPARPLSITDLLEIVGSGRCAEGLMKLLTEARRQLLKNGDIPKFQRVLDSTLFSIRECFRRTIAQAPVGRAQVVPKMEDAISTLSKGNNVTRIIFVYAISASLFSRAQQGGVSKLPLSLHGYETSPDKSSIIFDDKTYVESEFQLFQRFFGNKASLLYKRATANQNPRDCLSGGWKDDPGLVALAIILPRVAPALLRVWKNDATEQDWSVFRDSSRDPDEENDPVAHILYVQCYNAMLHLCESELKKLAITPNGDSPNGDVSFLVYGGKPSWRSKTKGVTTAQLVRLRPGNANVYGEVEEETTLLARLFPDDPGLTTIHDMILYNAGRSYKYCFWEMVRC